MSASAIEQELMQYQQYLGYSVRFSGQHVYVAYNGVRIGHECVLSGWRYHSRLAKKALKIVEDHQKAMSMLGSLVEPR